MDINLIIAQAQEQLQLVVKVQEKEWKEWNWMEETWKAQQEEWSSVVVSDKVVAEKALKRVAKEMWGYVLPGEFQIFLQPLSHILLESSSRIWRCW